MKKEIERLQAEIIWRRKNATTLLRQSRIMHEAAKGFNSVEHKMDAMRICSELNKEAYAEGVIANKLTEEYFRLVELENQKSADQDELD